MRNDTGPAREMHKPFPNQRPTGEPHSTRIRPLVRTFVPIEPPKGTKQILDSLNQDIATHIKSTIADYWVLAKASGKGGEERIDWDIHHQVGIPKTREAEVNQAFHQRSNELITKLTLQLKNHNLKTTPQVLAALNSKIQEQIIAAHDALVDGNAHALMDDHTEPFAVSHREIRGMTTHLAQQWQEKTTHATTLLEDKQRIQEGHTRSLDEFLATDISAPSLNALLAGIQRDKWYYHVMTPTQATSHPGLLTGIAYHLANEPTPDHPLLTPQRGESQIDKTARATLQTKINFFKKAASAANTIRDLDKITPTVNGDNKSDLKTLPLQRKQDHRIEGFENDVKLATQKATDANDPLASAIALAQLNTIARSKLAENDDMRNAQERVIAGVRREYLGALSKHAQKR